MLAISVKTETGADRSRPTAAELAGLLRRIGGDGDHFVVVDRLPAEDQVYVQTWRDGDGPFRVAQAFAALGAEGLTARMDFTCCSRCGLGEMAAERAEGDRGFAFFHHQDTESAAEGHGLAVRYGSYADFEEASGEAPARQAPADERAEIGRAVAAALGEAGLSVRWDGDPDRVIEVTPLDWRKRLPAGA
ncbi:DUF6891 domain-containing protein [Streptomyces sp. NPDC050355]|uniref:DUF6891 domain-containing protein n=1 Tax=Streptomyces sp. NPDC050355 TaxID=3365609 RepID=UPI00379EAF58